jgi:rare lipoprotein A
MMISTTAFAQTTVATGTASYYTVASCLREGTSGVMANGRRLNDEKYTCASWDYRFGTRLEVSRLGSKRKTVVVVTDRGPAKHLYHKGRIIDLSYAAMRALNGIKRGVILVEVRRLP